MAIFIEKHFPLTKTRKKEIEEKRVVALVLRGKKDTLGGGGDSGG